MQRVCISGIMSSQKLVLSGVPQGSVLGLLLCLTFINDLDLTLKICNDMKICSKIGNIADTNKLQEDLNMLQRNGK